MQPPAQIATAPIEQDTGTDKALATLRRSFEELVRSVEARGGAGTETGSSVSAERDAGGGGDGVSSSNKRARTDAPKIPYWRRSSSSRGNHPHRDASTSPGLLLGKPLRTLNTLRIRKV